METVRIVIPELKRYFITCGKLQIMRLTFFLVLVPSLIFLTISCRKEYSSEGKKNRETVVRDSLPVNYPFATGLCVPSTLGISAGEISDYQPDTSSALTSSLMLDMPASGNQGSQGSCAAWAVVYGLGSYYVHSISGKAYSDTGNLSPKFTYNQIAKGNCGCSSIIDNLYLLREEGAASLGSMPYDPAECSLQPDSPQKQNALDNRINNFTRVDLHNLSLIKRALSEKKPVVFAIAVDDGFKRLDSPFIWKDHAGATGEGHAMVIIGYDDSKGSLRILNSWSTAWADGGEAWIDYNFFLNNVQENGYVLN
jgi:C1A family cysteine protease